MSTGLGVGAAFGIPEGEFAHSGKATLHAFAKDRRHSFAGRDGRKLSYMYFPAPAAKGAIVIVTGRAEAAIKYSEVAYDLLPQGYSIFVLDWLGQGFSDRLLADRDIGYIARWDEYVSNLEDFLAKVPELKDQPTKFLLAHSMGASVAVHYLAKHPDVFKAAVFSAPMFNIHLGKTPAWLVQAIVATLDWIGRGEKYAPGMGPYSPDASFDKNVVTKSLPRFSYWRELLAQNDEIHVGGPSVRWVREAMRAANRTLEIAPTLRTPILILKADADVVVTAESYVEFVQAIPGAEIFIFPDSLHEILMERDTIRTPALEKTMAFFTSHAK